MPVNWIELIETPIVAYERDLNGSLGLNDQLSLNKGRYYPEYLWKKWKVCSSDSQVSSSDSEKDELDEHNHKEGWSKKRTLLPKKI